MEYSRENKKCLSDLVEVYNTDEELDSSSESEDMEEYINLEGSEKILDESCKEFIDTTQTKSFEIQSRDKKTIWTSVPPAKSKRYITDNISPKMGITVYAMQRLVTIRDAFELCFTEEMQNIILQSTNSEGRRVFGQDWKDLDLITLRAYIGILILAGLFKAPGETVENLWDNEKGRPIFGATMSKNNFKKLNRIIRFDKKDRQGSEDTLSPIRNLWDMWVLNLHLCFTPYENVTIQEQLVPFRGPCPIRQHLQSKSVKCGIKIWILCDSKTRYSWNVKIFTGKKPESTERNQTQKIVLDLAVGLKGRNVTVDSSFTSYKLAEELLNKGITLVGAVKPNKSFLPSFPSREILQRPIYSSNFYFSNSIMLVQYIPEKHRCMTVLSTLHSEKNLTDLKNKLPEIIHHYNKTRSGVDQLIRMYSVKRKTKRWPFALFCTMLDISGINAFALWLENNPAWNSNKAHKRRLFLQELGKQLVQEEVARRKAVPRTPSALKLMLAAQGNKEELAPGPSKKLKMSKGARCQLCTGKDRKAYSYCEQCLRFLCGEHKNPKYYCPDCT